MFPSPSWPATQWRRQWRHVTSRHTWVCSKPRASRDPGAVRCARSPGVWPRRTRAGSVLTVGPDPRRRAGECGPGLAAGGVLAGRPAWPPTRQVTDLAPPSASPALPSQSGCAASTAIPRAAGATDLHRASSADPGPGFEPSERSCTWRRVRGPHTAARGASQGRGSASNFWNENEIKAALSEIANFFFY